MHYPFLEEIQPRYFLTFYDPMGNLLHLMIPQEILRDTNICNLCRKRIRLLSINLNNIHFQIMFYWYYIFRCIFLLFKSPSDTIMQLCGKFGSLFITLLLFLNCEIIIFQSNKFHSFAKNNRLWLFCQCIMWLWRSMFILL